MTYSGIDTCVSSVSSGSNLRYQSVQPILPPSLRDFSRVRREQYRIGAQLSSVSASEQPRARFSGDYARESEYWLPVSTFFSLEIVPHKHTSSSRIEIISRAKRSLCSGVNFKIAIQCEMISAFVPSLIAIKAHWSLPCNIRGSPPTGTLNVLSNCEQFWTQTPRKKEITHLTNEWLDEEIRCSSTDLLKCFAYAAGPVNTFLDTGSNSNQLELEFI